MLFIIHTIQGEVMVTYINLNLLFILYTEPHKILHHIPGPGLKITTAITHKIQWGKL